MSQERGSLNMLSRFVENLDKGSAWILNFLWIWDLYFLVVLYAGSVFLVDLDLDSA